MIAFDTNVLVCATAAISDDKVTRARNLIAGDTGRHRRAIAANAR
jgi:hypothetical protein